MASSANWAIRKTCLDKLGLLMLFMVSTGQGFNTVCIIITNHGISHIPLTCSYRYTKSPVEDVIICYQETRCIALYKKWEADGTRVHQTCSCAIHPGNSTLSVVETKHIFMCIHRGKWHPGKLLNTWGHEKNWQDIFQCTLAQTCLFLFSPYSRMYGTLCICICICAYIYIYVYVYTI